MRLLQQHDNGDISLTEDIISNIPVYAILSHTWGTATEEVDFKELINGTGKSKTGYKKIQFCGEQAKRDGLRYFWVDTCCIDKSNSAEFSEAINSMFRWYRDATRCYVYLNDVPAPSAPDWKAAFAQSRWFTRGWTLQELIAPKVVDFFSHEDEINKLGSKKDLEQDIHAITGITIDALRGRLSRIPLETRLSWAENRNTKREEDKAYCLLGILDIFLPVTYGVEDKAWRQLLREIEILKGRGIEQEAKMSTKIKIENGNVEGFEERRNGDEQNKDRVRRQLPSLRTHKS